MWWLTIVCLGFLTAQSAFAATCPEHSRETNTVTQSETRKHADSPYTGELGLQVDAKGALTNDGKPYRGIGVNFFSAFHRTLSTPNNTTYREGFKTLSELGIPFARICGGGYWAVDFKIFSEEREKYLERLDGVVKAAEEYNVGLIPSFAWFIAGVPDLVGEPVSAWGDPKSKTSDFMRTYVREIVTRYRNSPAIWAWEFGNEFSLYADLPNADKHRPLIAPAFGTPETRTERDDLSYKMMRTAFVEYANEVRKYDKKRAVITGNSFPRPTAWHHMTEKSWTEDTREQYEEMLLGDNPDPMDTISVHMYNDMPTRFGKQITFDELLELTMKISKKARKPLFIGEFGAQTEDDPEVTRTRFSQMLSAIEKHEVPLSALWVFDYKPQDKVWNITATNERSWQLAAIAEANKRIAAGHTTD